jgi:FlaA1/EpsC-like NDP-sugar epimerase
MTVREAAELVIQAGAICAQSAAPGGELYVLDMGDPIRIAQLAERMIQLSGQRVDRGDGLGIAIAYTGLGDGEKLTEELLIDSAVAGTSHPKILRAEERGLPQEELVPLLDAVERACDAADEAVLGQLLARALPGFVPPGAAAGPSGPPNVVPLRQG